MEVNRKTNIAQFENLRDQLHTCDKFQELIMQFRILNDNSKWQWILISTFYLVSGWYDGLLLEQKEILGKKVLDVSQIHMEPLYVNINY